MVWMSSSDRFSRTRTIVARSVSKSSASWSSTSMVSSGRLVLMVLVRLICPCTYDRLNTVSVQQGGNDTVDTQNVCESPEKGTAWTPDPSPSGGKYPSENAERLSLAVRAALYPENRGSETAIKVTDVSTPAFGGESPARLAAPGPWRWAGVVGTGGGIAATRTGGRPSSAVAVAVSGAIVERGVCRYV